ncbi:alpha/beta hydrolase [Simiduia curdlanivorans]|uniref:Alpha/beta hydrolase n=1 Tax=Simiduia curdlanivorans TaxID=1492769 RepID=A0ABV8V3B1_9GAMM|nr:alpha/beta hydrolase [Simiduia curdlanivorans]MDN3637575.1 alpha/beta hydrolase [Simiduia curdlanivorans]MDN3639906.1 alpha/beta hydrolase [Simiduia curdlanivorans]
MTLSALKLLKGLGARLGWCLFGFLAGMLVIVYLWSQTRPALSFWHDDSARYTKLTELPNLSETSWQAYLAHEQTQFIALSELLTKKVEMGKAPTAPWHRFSPTGAANPALYPINGNRSYWLKPDQPARFKAVLIHGLSDSPYSLRAIGEDLRRHGGEVFGLRVPGHGLLPGHLLDTRWEDARAAVTMAVRAAADDNPHNLPLLLVGYSNGAALSVDYALQALEDDTLRQANGLVLISPALKLSPLAGFAKLQRWLGKLPGLNNLAWVDIYPEYDPFKFNSFPVNAGQQIYELTRSIHERLSNQSVAQRLTDFPPMLVFQSVVDATVDPSAPIHDLLLKLPQNQHQLVLFDVNHQAQAQGYLKQQHQQLLAQLNSRPLPFNYTLVANPDSELAVNALTRSANSLEASQEMLALSWPRNVYSLSHVALPIRPTDLVYGNQRAVDSKLHLGSGGGLGERGAFIVSMEQLNRLRYNPFYPYLQQRINDFADSLGANQHPN